MDLKGHLVPTHPCHSGRSSSLCLFVVGFLLQSGLFWLSVLGRHRCRSWCSTEMPGGKQGPWKLNLVAPSPIQMARACSNRCRVLSRWTGLAWVKEAEAGQGQTRLHSERGLGLVRRQEQDKLLGAEYGRREQSKPSRALKWIKQRAILWICKFSADSGLQVLCRVCEAVPEGPQGCS